MNFKKQTNLVCILHITKFYEADQTENNHFVNLAGFSFF